jgi:hypothetical protein
MPPHNFHDEGALMRIGRTDDCVAGLYDPVQSTVRPDGHICATEIIVDGAHKPGNLERAIFLLLVNGDLFGGDEFLKKRTPLLAEEIGAGETTVTADHHQIGDAAVHQVLGGFETSRALLEVHATRGTDHRAPLVDDGTDRGPVGLDDVLAAVNHALVALLNEIHFTSQVYSHAHHGPHGGIHSLKIALSRLAKISVDLTCESPPLVKTAIPLPLWAPRPMNLWPVWPSILTGSGARVSTGARAEGGGWNYFFKLFYKNKTIECYDIARVVKNFDRNKGKLILHLPLF